MAKAYTEEQLQKEIEKLQAKRHALIAKNKQAEEDRKAKIEADAKANESKLGIWSELCADFGETFDGIDLIDADKETLKRNKNVYKKLGSLLFGESKGISSTKSTRLTDDQKEMIINLKSSTDLTAKEIAAQVECSVPQVATTWGKYNKEKK